MTNASKETSSADHLGAVARTMLDAYDRNEMVSCPSSRFDLSLDEAHSVAITLRSMRIARGEQFRGFKIGFTNRNIWERYGVDGPIFAPVWNTTAIDASDIAALDSTQLSQPRIEPEIVFGFSKDVPGDATPEILASCIDWAAHGFEIVHCHYPNWKFSAADTVVDFGLHGRLIIGTRISVAGGIETLRSLANTSVQLSCNREPIETGIATNVLGGPFEALVHFHEVLRKHPGYGSIRAGDVVTTGTITDAYSIKPGQIWATSLSDTILRDMEIRVA
jgi:2-keto-4-pentenoate hydratase